MEEAVSSIRLTDDIVLTKQYSVSSDLTLDLNGHELSAAIRSPLFNVDGGTLTLKGGSVSNSGQVGIVTNGGEIVVENGTYTSSSAEVFRVAPQGSVVINDGELTGREGAVTTRGNGDNNGCNGRITVNGGHLTGTDNFAVATNGSSGMGRNVVTINGGTLIGNIQSPGFEAIGVYIANDDDFVMNGGEIIAYGGTGLCQRGGSVTINAGTITANAQDKNGNIVPDGKVGDDATVLEGVSGIVYHKSAKYSGSTGMSLTINGGTIHGEDHSIQALTDEEIPNIYINGGTLIPAYPEAVTEEP